MKLDAQTAAKTYLSTGTEITSTTKNPKLSNEEALFLVWTTPGTSSSRSHSFARELGIGDPEYIYFNIKRSKKTAPLRYFVQAFQSLRLLFQKRPRVVFVQSPPSYAAIVVALYSLLTGSKFVVDAHTDALSRKIWNWPPFLNRFLASRASATIVTDEHFKQIIEERGGKAVVMKDPVTSYSHTPYPLPDGFVVTVVNTFSFDEPLDEVLAAARRLPDVHFFVTGRVSKADPDVLASAPENVKFTDFLSSEEYYGLLRGSDVVMSLTLRDHTYQCGAGEGLSLARPLITSQWPMLMEYFSRGTVHVQGTSDSIYEGIQKIRASYPRYAQEIEDLRRQRREEWDSKVSELIDLVSD